MRVPINGIIATDDDAPVYEYFGYSAFCPRMIRQALQDNPPGEALELEINSCGGNVFAGFEIFSVLLEAGVHTVAKIQSLAASAASTIAAACKEVQISPVAQIMIHLPTCGASGDRNVHLGAVQSLDSIAEGILNGYVNKVNGKCSRETLEELINNETWISAAKAVSYGLADKMMGGTTANIVNAFGLPDIDELRSSYAAQQIGHSWQAEAAAELEDISNFLKGMKTYA